MAEKKVPARPYQLMVDSGSREEPDTRWFASLAAAWKAYDELDEKWKPYADVRLATLEGPYRLQWPRVDREGNREP